MASGVVRTRYMSVELWKYKTSICYNCWLTCVYCTITLLCFSDGKKYFVLETGEIESFDKPHLTKNDCLVSYPAAQCTGALENVLFDGGYGRFIIYHETLLDRQLALPRRTVWSRRHIQQSWSRKMLQLLPPPRYCDKLARRWRSSRL